MNRLGFASFRRITAIVVVLVLGLWNAETALADVCDGGSPVSASCAIASHSPQPLDPTAPLGGSGVQVCHCQHAHGGLPAVHGIPMPIAVMHAGMLRAVSRGIPPAIAAPLFRPPIS
jgi:hypothetical protein